MKSRNRAGSGLVASGLLLLGIAGDVDAIAPQADGSGDARFEAGWLIGFEPLTRIAQCKVRLSS